MVSCSKPNEIEKFSAELIEGRCMIWNGHVDGINDDEFCLKEPLDLPRCQICPIATNRAKAISGPPLRALDLFSGAGGLSMGLEFSGVARSDWAVEYEASAAASFQYVFYNSPFY